MLRHSPHLTASLLVPSFSNYLSNLDIVEPTFQRFFSFTAELSERDCWASLSCPKDQESAVIDAFSEFTVFLASLLTYRNPLSNSTTLAFMS